MALLGPQKPLKTVLASVAMLGVVSSAPALAQDQTPQLRSVSATTDTPQRAIDSEIIQFHDVRDHPNNPAGFANLAAKHGSLNVAIVKLHTDDQEIIDRAHDHLRSMSMSGWEHVGLLLAQGENGLDNTGEIWIGGRNGLVDTIDNLDTQGLEGRLGRVIRGASPNQWRPEEFRDPGYVSAANTASPP